jgi:hypothetical protein
MMRKSSSRVPRQLTNFHPNTRLNMSTHELPQQLAKSTSGRLGKIAAFGLALAAIAPMAQALVIDTSALSISPTGILDLKDNALVWRNGSLATINGYLSTGINLAGLPPGAPGNSWWDGYQVQSSVAALDGNNGTATLVHGLGGVLNELDATLGGGPLLTSVQGVPVGITDVIVLFTCMGDADLDGFITPTDQFLLDNGTAQGLSGWINGDFDYDGTLSPTDQFLLDNSAGNGCVPPPAPGAVAAVPEPNSLVLLMAGLVGIVSRRKRDR